MAEKEQAETATAVKPKKKWLKWSLLVIVALILVGAGIGAWLFYKAQPKGTASDEQQSTSEQKAQDPNVISDPYPEIIPLERFKVEIPGPFGKKDFWTQFSLELFNPSERENVENDLPRLRETILTYLKTQTLNDLSRMEGKIIIKNELLRRINKLFKRTVVRKVYITEFIIK